MLIFAFLNVVTLLLYKIGVKIGYLLSEQNKEPKIKNLWCYNYQRAKCEDPKVIVSSLMLFKVIINYDY